MIARLWGGGEFADGALAASADAVSSGHPATRSLYFEVAQANMMASRTTDGRRNEQNLRTVAWRIRQIGVERVFDGSDGPQFGWWPPRETWAHFWGTVPLSDQEFTRIANNVAPYARRRGSNRRDPPAGRGPRTRWHAHTALVRWAAAPLHRADKRPGREQSGARSAAPLHASSGRATPHRTGRAPPLPLWERGRELISSDPGMVLVEALEYLPPS